VDVEKLLVVLGTFAAAAYLLIGIVGGLWGSHWDDASAADQIIWVVLLVGGAVLLFAGLRISRRSPWGGAALISLGAVAGALPIFWTVIALLVAFVLVVLSVMYARRATAGAAPAPD
jgi:hypothetical protein